MPKTGKPRAARLLPDEERAVDELLPSLLSGRQGRSITTVEKLVTAICRQKRDLDEDAVIQYLGVLARRGELRTNGSRQAPAFQFVSPGSTVSRDEDGTSAPQVSTKPAVAFAQLGKRTKLTGRMLEEFDRLLLMDLERRGNAVALHPWVLELPQRYPRMCNTAGRTMFSYPRVYGALLRLAARGAVTMKKENGRWRVQAVKKVAGADALAALHDRSTSAPAGVAAAKLAELQDLERRRDQLMEELAKLVQRIESLRFELYCQAIAAVSRGSPA